MASHMAKHSAAAQAAPRVTSQPAPQPAPQSVPQVAPHAAHQAAAAQPAHQPAPQPVAQPAAQPHSNFTAAPLPISAMGITSLVMGVVALVISWVPIINNLTCVFSVLGLIFAIVGLLGIKHNKRRGKGITYAGLIISIVSFAIMLATQAFYGAALQAVSDKLNGTSGAGTSSAASDSSKGGDANSANSANSGSGSGNGAGNGDASKQDANAASDENPDGDVANGHYHITIKNAVVSGEDHDGNPTVLVTYEATNKQKDKTSNMFDWEIKVFQKGATLSNTPFFVHKPKGYDPKATHVQTQIQAGGSFTYTEAFVLRDKKEPIRVEIASPLGGEGKVTKTFNLS